MTQQLTARLIQASTKGEVKRLRNGGQVPISLQHRGEPTLHLQTEARPLDEFIRQYGEAAVLEIKLDSGEVHGALVHDIQRDAVSHSLLQVTLQRVVRGEAVKVHVPLVFHGSPRSVSEHTAVVQHLMEQVEVRCLPRDLPDHITVDVSDMAFGDTLRVSDLTHDARYEILTPADTAVVSLSSLLNQPEETTEPAEAPAETSASATEHEA